MEQLPDSTYYNQVSSKDMYAYFVNGQMRRSDAVRNVRSIYFPIDSKDSTLIGLNYVETDTMKMYMSPNRQLERIWMPKAQGTLYPCLLYTSGLSNFVFLCLKYLFHVNFCLITRGNIIGVK